MLFRQFRSKKILYKLFFLVIIFLSLYNLFPLVNLEKLKIEKLFLPEFNKNPKGINNQEDMKAKHLHIVPHKIHRHLTESINNSLFLGQGHFKMPLNSDLIHGNLPLDIFPHRNHTDNDRIWHQMRYVPSHLIGNQKNVGDKLILLYNGLAGTSNEAFKVCPVYKCKITDDREMAKKADVILWMHNVMSPFHRRPPGQIWAVYFLESPLHTPQFRNFEINPSFQINWTATYRHDSTIVAPYFKYTPYNLVQPQPKSYPLPTRNYATGKTKMAAWFVSNCASLNDRMKVAQELKTFVEVDIYGGCGSLKCPRHQNNDCFDLLNKQYKFYLAFENSNCIDYITEKFFLNGLSNDVIPIVMGAHPDEYKRVSPPHSFIHIEDFENISQLANYMKYLDKNDTAYNEYFSWKGYGMVDTNTFFWCRLCMMAHEADNTKSVLSDVYGWWFGNKSKTCIGREKWKKQKII